MTRTLVAAVFVALLAAGSFAQAPGLTDMDRLKAQLLQERQARLNVQVQLVLEQSGLAAQLRELNDERTALERDLVVKLGGEADVDRIGDWSALTLAERTP